MNFISPLTSYNFPINLRTKSTILHYSKPPNCTNSVQITTLSQNAEEPKLKWINLELECTPDQKKLISQLPKKMSNRCKALCKRLICLDTQNETLDHLLSSWIDSMNPERADWLAVLKEMNIIRHPLYFEMVEYALLEETFEAHIRDYSKLIHKYAKQDNLEKAEKTLEDMKKRGFSCDQVTLTAQITMYSKAGNLNRSIEIFEEMKLLGFSIDKRAYSAMAMSYIRADMLKTAENLMKESENQEIFVGREVYKALLRAYAENGDSIGAQRVFDSIQFAGIVPDSSICSHLIKAYCLANQINEARCVVENMRKVGLKPLGRSINLILQSYEIESRLDDAIGFLMEMERDEVEISKEVFEVLSGWFERIGVKDEMEEIIREGFESNNGGEFKKMERIDGFYAEKMKAKIVEQ